MIRHVKGIQPSRANASKRALELERPTGSNLLHRNCWSEVVQAAKQTTLFIGSARLDGRAYVTNHP